MSQIVLTYQYQFTFRIIFNIFQLLTIYMYQVEEAGLEVLRKEEKTLTKEEAMEFYKHHEGSEHFEQLVEFMCR